jgi:DNA-binding PadR family transcriptional regulator
MLVILEFLYTYSSRISKPSLNESSNRNSQAVSISKYHIMTKIPELKQQRQDRISTILRTLEDNGLIISTATPNATFYRITEKGADTYLKWVGHFLSFFRELKNREDENL